MKTSTSAFVQPSLSFQVLNQPLVMSASLVMLIDIDRVLCTVIVVTFDAEASNL